MRRFAPAPRRTSSFARVCFGIIIAVGLALTTISAQIPGRNINMVAGNTWPDGDPYLQRQNEPSIGASTRNPLHLLAGSNDYRTVDLPGLAEDETGDAWLGLFKSFDGGQRWISTLLPGYPQDHSPIGLASPISGYGAGADAVVRAGTNGLMYFAGLAFDRANPLTPDVPGKSAIFVARFIDNNNKEAGDPFEYLGTRALQTDPGGATGNFLDKPWMVVDIPRDTSRCTIVTAGEKGPITQSIPAGPVYVAYTLRSTDNKGARYDVMFTRSADCGNTWTTPVRLNDSNERANQGAAMAVDPRNGNVYIAWRQFDLSTNGTGTDALMAAKFTLAGKQFGKPGFARKFAKPKKGKGKGLDLTHFFKKGGVNKALEAAELSPLDQSTSASQIRFRTNAYPTMTIDENGRIYMAFAERGYDPQNPDPVLGPARVLLTTSLDGQTWTTAQPVNNNEVGQKGHQLMPSITYAGGKLMLIYYDLRESRAQVVSQYIDDKTAFAQETRVTGLRHTIDLRASMASPGAVPVFAPSVAVSEYIEGPRTPGGPSTPWQVNPPNLPMFQKGTAPFIGDYVDIAAAPNFVLNSAGKWVYNNTAGSTPPIFHAAWTDNRDVRVPLIDLTGPNGVPDGNPWNDYTPPSGPGGFASIFDPTKIVPMCIPGNAGSRNQNIYTARITGGLLVGSPGNTKRLGYRIDEFGTQLNTLMERSFVVFAQNTVAAPPDQPELATRRFRFTINNQPIGGRASFDQFSATPLTAIDADIPYRSTASRTVYATSTDPHAIINVSVAELVQVNNAWVVKTGGLGSVIVLNPDIDNPDIDNPDIDNPDIDNPDIDNVEVFNPDIDNPDIDNPDIDNPDIDNPDIDNPDIDNIRVANPDIDNPDIDNPDIDNPDIDNPDIDNPDIDNPDIDNGSLMTDVSWAITNTGNTTASYNVNLFFAQQTYDPRISTQLILYRTYKTPVVRNCDLKSETRNVLVANVPNPQLVMGSTGGVSNPNDSAATNATIYLAPGESAKITLRVFDPAPPPGSVVEQLKADGVTKVYIPSQFVPNEDVTPVVQQQSVNTEDVDEGVTEPPILPQFPAPQAVDDVVSTTPNTPVTLNVLGNDSAAFGSTKILSAHPAGLGQNMGGPANEMVYMPTTGLLYAGSGRTVGVIDPATNRLVGRIPFNPSDGAATYSIASPASGLVFFRMGGSGQPGASIYGLDARPASPTFHQFGGLISEANEALIDALGDAVTIALDRNGLVAYYAAGFIDQNGNANTNISISAVNVDPSNLATFGSILWTKAMPTAARVWHVAQNPVTGKVYIAAQGPQGGVYVIDPAAPALPSKIVGADQATTIAFNPATNLIVAAGVFSNTYRFNLIDGSTHAILGQRQLPGGSNRGVRTFANEDRLVVHHATGKVFLRTQSEVFTLDAQKGSAGFNTLGPTFDVGTEFGGQSDLVIDQATGVVATAGNFRLSTFFIDAVTNTMVERLQSRAGGELAVDSINGRIFSADFLSSIYTYTAPSAAAATLTNTLTVFPETANAIVNPSNALGTPATSRAYVGVNLADAAIARVGGSGALGGIAANTKGRWGFMARHDATNRFVVANSGANVAGTTSRPGSIAVINGATDTVTASVDTVGQPFGVAINQATKQVYVAGLSGLSSAGQPESGKIAIHNLDSPEGFVDVTIDPSMPLPPNTPSPAFSFGRHVAINPTTGRVYVMVIGGSPVSLVSLEPSAMGAPATAFPIDVSGSLPATALPPRFPGDTDLNSPASDYRVDVIRVAPAPLNRIYLGMANQVAISRGVPNAYRVVVLDGTTNTVIPGGVIAAGSHSRQHTASWLALDAARNKLFVVDFVNDKVSTFNATTLAQPPVETPLPDGPSASAINFSAGRLYVSSVLDKSITAIDIATSQILSTVKLPLQAFFLYPDEVESRLYTTGGNSFDESGVMVVTDVLGKLGTDVSVDPIITGAEPGAAVGVNADYSVTYVPPPTFTGADSFDYVVRNQGGTATGTVTVNVIPVVERVIATGDAYSVPQRFGPADPGITIAAPGVKANDVFGTGSYNVEVTTGPAFGTLSANGDGSFTYTPNVGHVGTDSFVYRLNGPTTSNLARVWITTVVAPNPYVVTNTNQSGTGSLAGAITNANAAPGVQTITFNIPNAGPLAPATINMSASLPAITDSVVIDGTTHPSYDGQPYVEVRGPSNTAGPGFSLSANNVTIKGLSITRFGQAILANSGFSGHLIEGNIIGTNRAGGNFANATGILVRAASVSILNNVISRNSTDGVSLSDGAAGAVIAGNYIGTTALGAIGYGNIGAGVRINNASGNTIGGNSPAARNVIVGNSWGISIQTGGTGASNGNVIAGNYVGILPDGNTQHNNANGIMISATAGGTINGTVIGGSSVGERNVIAGNFNNGIGLYGAGVTSTSIRGNYIGVAADGTTPRANTAAGVWISDSSNNTVGGLNAVDGNVIAFNTQVGVGMNGAGVGNRVLTNAIHSNNGPGISLADSANGLLSGPNLTSATNNGATTAVSVDLSHMPVGSYTVQFFANGACDGSGKGEGQRFVGVATIVQPGGSANLTELVPNNQVITATATDSNDNTSVFSNCRAIANAPVITSVSPNPSAPGFGQLLWIQGTNLPGVSTADVIFNFGGSDSSAQHIWYMSPTLVVARFNVGTPVGNATVRVKSPDGSLVSNAFAIQVQSTPGAPLLTSLSTNCTNNGFINSALSGSTIYVGAQGIDSSGATVVFTPTSPAGAPTEVAAAGTCGNSSAMSAAFVTVPAFAPGTVVNVQIKTTVGTSTSPLSNAHQITIEDTSVLVGPAGGNGGLPFAPVNCPAGSVVIGFTGRAGDDIDQTRIVCAPKPALAPPTTLFVAGGNGGTDYGGALSCGAGAAVTGVFGASRGGAQIDYMGVTCTNLDTLASYNTGTVGLSQAPVPFTLSCPAGKQVIGVEGRQGLLLDQISIRCK